ncbi:MAG: serine/threonine protein kinase [Planctomycetia bacterium]|nr:serine/threonine protein kinase [Planctomycetia bacterium]
MAENSPSKPHSSPAQSAPQSISDFLRVVRASGLVDEARLAAAVAPWMVSPEGPVPDEMVQALLDAELLTQWQVDQLRKGKHKGFMLGKYKLLRLLGAGGMSSVYLAEHSTLHHKVAIKVLPLKRVEQSSYLARFEREAQASARLNHPNIARAFDLETSGAIHFIVMEYVEGTDLHGKVKQEGPLDVREAADFIRQAALGLHFAHEEGLVHRDIKPANLMLDKRGTVKILDLGLALADDDEAASLTREHDEKVLGTADYLAPEQARDSHKADRRSDIYSLGCTLFYLLVGKAPFASGTLAERIRAHMNEPAPNLLERRPDVPAAIAEIYFRMMEKHPDARQQTAQEIADTLAAWLAATAETKARQRPEPPRRATPRRTPGDSTAAGTAAGPPRRTAPGPVVRSGPGSGSGSNVRIGGGNDSGPAGPTSNVDLSALQFTPPPSSDARSTQKLPATAAKPAATSQKPIGSPPGCQSFRAWWPRSASWR